MDLDALALPSNNPISIDTYIVNFCFGDRRNILKMTMNSVGKQNFINRLKGMIESSENECDNVQVNVETCKNDTLKIYPLEEYPELWI